MREQRRSRRIVASIPLEILSNGEPQSALTAVINLHGALILSFVDWPSESNLRIKNPDTGLEVRARVVWSGSRDPNGSFKLGVEFQASSPEFWGERYDPQGEEAP
jgi:PilZ domain